MTKKYQYLGKLLVLRRLLEVPEDQRIGQWIYNCNRDLEVPGKGDEYSVPRRGVDLFDIGDEEFMNKLFSNKSQS